MALLTPAQGPSISDTILFDIFTPGADGCPPVDDAHNTYIVNNVTIYFVERDFSTPDSQEQEYDLQHLDSSAEAAADAAALIVCQNPTAPNIEDLKSEAARLRAIADSYITVTPFYYKDTTAVAVFGTADFPAWLRTDPDNSILQPYKDDEDNIQPGYFTLEWNPEGSAREGDYFICWTWTPLPAGDTISSHIPFYLAGDTQITTALPTHQTVPGKYVKLLDQYLPEMFKMHLCTGDLTPEVLTKFHAALAKGFTDIENLSNQLIDLLDANCVAEAFIPYLSNFFNLKLRSTDPTLWRRQIKRAVPLFKQKGTLAGLSSAIAQSGALLNKFTMMWQVASPYTYTDMFYVDSAAEVVFYLTYPAKPVDPSNFSLLYRPAGSSNYSSLGASYVDFTTADGITSMSWMGATQPYPLSLHAGDLIVVKYLVRSVPGGKQSSEDYIQSLDLADQRDALDAEGNLMVPLKNWNVHVMEEDDPMFDVLIPTRQPYAEDVVFGKVRTEFAYSENIYNSDEWNGSRRDSTDPCDIDQDFLDECTACRSSKFTVDVEIQDLSDDKVNETLEIINEYSPFHAVLHRLNITGGVNEFLVPAVESVETLATMRQEEYTFAGNANDVFTRYRLNGYDPASVRRNMLASTTTVVSSATGTAYNSSVTLYCPEVRFDELPISSRTVLEVLSPSPNAGIYNSVQNPLRHTLEVSGVPEPLNTAAFTFRLSNSIYTNPSASVTQDDYFELIDAAVDFGELGVVSQWDVDNQAGISHSAWTVNIPAYGTFTVADVFPNGSLSLSDPSQLLPTSPTSGISYAVVNDSAQTVASSTTGKLSVVARGRVQVSDVNVPDIRGLVSEGFYLLYSGNQYKVIGFVDGSDDEVYIGSYTGGNASGVSVTFYHRWEDMEIGYFDYKGMMLDAGSDLETSLGILNGENAPTDPNLVLDNNHFKENYIVLIGTNYYRIADIDHNTLTLIGPQMDYKTLGAGGQSVTYSVIRFVKNSITIDGHDFDFIDRRGVDLVDATITSNVSMMSVAMTALNTSNGSQIETYASQDEGVSFVIEYSDGTTSEGEV